MTDEHILCAVCWEPSPDGLACTSCTARLRADLRALPELMRELDVTLTRQAKTTQGTGRSTGIPLAFGFDASWAKDAIVGTVSTWIRDLAEQHGEDLNRTVMVAGGHACTVVTWWAPGRSMTEWVAWLMARMHRIRAHPAAPQLWDEMRDAVMLARRTIDRPAEREFVTTCVICGHGVYGSPGAPDDAVVPCRECRRVADRDEETGEVSGYVPEYGVGESRTVRFMALRDSHVPAELVATAVSVLRGEPLRPDTASSWIRRGRLPQRATSTGGEDRPPAGTPLYSVREAMELAALIPAQNRSGPKARREAVTA